MGEQDNEAVLEIKSFIDSWSGDTVPMRDCFQRLYQEMSSLSGVSFSFVARPGVSYSIRPRHTAQKDRDLFAIVDVIDDDPEDRWLSVCFYGDMISDPDGRGEVIPGGLAGSDGYCFDLYDYDEEYTAYITERIKEAGTAAAK